MNKTLKLQSGFTLIELIVYLALFGILFSGAVAGTYSILESSGKNQSRVMMQEEGEFLLAKISWVVSGANTAQVLNGDQLLVSSTLDNFEFKQNGDNLVWVKNSGPEVLLNNSAVRLKNLSFVDIASGNGQKGIRYGFNLETNVPSGAIMTSNFESIVYLRK